MSGYSAALKNTYGDKPRKNDGYRVWPRGVTKDALAIDAWLKEVAPSNELRKW